MLINSKPSQFLEHKIQILQEELLEYKQKQNKQKKLNESILQTYKQNQCYRQSREQKLQRDLRQISLKHKQQIRRLKTQHSKQKSQLQLQNNILKQEFQQLKLKFQQIQIQSQKTILQTKRTIQTKHETNLKQLQNTYKHQIQELNQNKQQLINTIQMYKQYLCRKNQQNYHVQTKRGKVQSNQILFNRNFNIQSDNYRNFNIQPDNYRGSNNQNMYEFISQRPYFRQTKNYERDNQMHKINTIQNINIQAKRVLKATKHSITQINRRINRAVSEIKQDQKSCKY